MPVTPSYPGLYIEELPLSAHSIQAAPTSITAIVGYTHPFKTRRFNEAVHLFSFTDYEREFGGMFASGLIETHVPLAVNQFFLNGGSDLYVVGLAPTIQPLPPPSPTPAPPPVTYDDPSVQPTVSIPTSAGSAIVFNAREPTDLLPMTVSIGNIRVSSSAALDTFDLTIAYGRRVETYRGLTLAASAPRQLSSINGQSGLVTVAGLNAVNPADFGTGFAASATIVQMLSSPSSTAFLTNFDAQDFVRAFQTDSSLDKVPIFNILLTPGIFDNTVNSAAVAFAERKRAFVILDPPPDAAADESLFPVKPVNDPSFLDVVPLSENAALYFPYLRSADPVTGNPIDVAPSGYVAGIYARTDQRRGVWKAPAGIEATLINTVGVVPSGVMNNERQGVLYGVIAHTVPVNCLRSFPGAGTVVFGARTVVGSNPAYNQSKYVPVRRMTLFIEQTLLANLTWVVFEPNDVPLWISIRTSIENFMLSLFNQGALQGTKPSEAFQVKCDHSTTTQQDVDNGIVNIIVAFAPLKPAEFVIIKIAQLAGQTQTA